MPVSSRRVNAFHCIILCIVPNPIDPLGCFEAFFRMSCVGRFTPEGFKLSKNWVHLQENDERANFRASQHYACTQSTVVGRLGSTRASRANHALHARKPVHYSKWISSKSTSAILFSFGLGLVVTGDDSVIVAGLVQATRAPFWSLWNNLRPKSLPSLRCSPRVTYCG